MVFLTFRFPLMSTYGSPSQILAKIKVKASLAVVDRRSTDTMSCFELAVCFKLLSEQKIFAFGLFAFSPNNSYLPYTINRKIDISNHKRIIVTFFEKVIQICHLVTCVQSAESQPVLFI